MTRKQKIIPGEFVRYDVEYTDTFGGEANYCWVTRKIISVFEPAGISRDKFNARVKRAAKTSLGLSGMPGQWSDDGDTLSFRPRSACVVAFVTWHDCSINDDCDHDEMELA